jgi:hypothetical protein
VFSDGRNRRVFIAAAERIEQIAIVRNRFARTIEMTIEMTIGGEILLYINFRQPVHRMSIRAPAKNENEEACK